MKPGAQQATIRPTEDLRAPHLTNHTSAAVTGREL